MRDTVPKNRTKMVKEKQRDSKSLGHSVSTWIEPCLMLERLQNSSYVNQYGSSSLWADLVFTKYTHAHTHFLVLPVARWMPGFQGLVSRTWARE